MDGEAPQHRRRGRLLTQGRMWRAASAAVRTVRDGWLIVGVTLLLFLGLEPAYRIFRAVRDGPRPRAIADPTLHPYAKFSWWPEFEQNLAQRHNRFDPYRAYLGIV